jgi:hypothetical protein
MTYESPSQPTPQGRGCLSWLGYGAIILLGAVVGFIVLTVAGIFFAGDRFFTGVDSMFNSPTPTPTIDVGNIVVRQIRDASELTTTLFAMETVVEAAATNEIAGFPIGTTRLLLIAYGEVRAGIDLSQITEEDVTVLSDTIQIRIPPPRIIDSKIDVNQTRVYDYDQGFLSLGPDVGPQLADMAQEEALAKVSTSACENGILEEANERAAIVLQGLFSGIASGRRVEIITQAPTTCP